MSYVNVNGVNMPVYRGAQVNYGQARIHQNQQGQMVINARNTSDQIAVNRLANGFVGVNVNNQQFSFDPRTTSGFKINANGGNDNITIGPGLDGIPITVNNGRGNDTVTNFSNNVRINDQGGSDNYRNFASGAQITDRSGRNSITSYGNANTMNLRDRDSVSIQGSGNTVNARNGNQVNAWGAGNVVNGRHNNTVNAWGVDNHVTTPGVNNTTNIAGRGNTAFTGNWGRVGVVGHGNVAQGGWGSQVRGNPWTNSLSSGPYGWVNQRSMGPSYWNFGFDLAAQLSGWA